MRNPLGLIFDVLFPLLLCALIIPPVIIVGWWWLATCLQVAHAMGML